MDLESIAEQIKTCTLCPLAQTRTNPVPGEGNPKAEIMFVGEAPGKNEDLQGRPFVGKAGQLLNELLEGVGLKREDIFITNIVKCRPPGNRDPRPEEIQACAPYLDKQIEVISPKAIVGLGRYASQHLFEKYGLEFPGITTAHGRPYKIDNLYHHFLIFPIYHPAAAIYNQRLRPILEEDFKTLKETIDRLIK
ncbi:MAG: type-4 uracil-DNA glycosylase [Candidatus Asgardarchaeia archaeon]